MMFRNLSKNNEKQHLGFLKVVAYDAYIDMEKKKKKTYVL